MVYPHNLSYTIKYVRGVSKRVAQEFDTGLFFPTSFCLETEFPQPQDLPFPWECSQISMVKCRMCGLA